MRNVPKATQLPLCCAFGICHSFLFLQLFGEKVKQWANTTEFIRRFGHLRKSASYFDVHKKDERFGNTPIKVHARAAQCFRVSLSLPEHSLPRRMASTSDSHFAKNSPSSSCSRWTRRTVWHSWSRPACACLTQWPLWVHPALAAQTAALTVHVFPCAAWDSQGAIFSNEDTLEISRDMLKNDRKKVYKVRENGGYYMYSALGVHVCTRPCLLLCVLAFVVCIS